VMVTHDQEEAMTMADRIAVMSEGQFKQVGRPNEIYETPSCRFVADFIGNVNLFDGQLEIDEPDHCVVGSDYGSFYVNHGVTGTLGMPATVAVRPEKVSLQRDPPADAQHNCLRGEIADNGYFGSFSLYRVNLPGGKKLQIQITHGQRHGELFQRGETVYATFAPDALVVLTS
jgi:putrescine transport system ATP-binding protein